MSSSVTVKYPMGSKHKFVTTPSEICIVNLEPVLHSSTSGSISYGLYKQNEDGSKYIEEQYAEIEEGKKKLVNAAPVLEKTIVEHFEFKKAGYMEVFKDEE